MLYTAAVAFIILIALGTVLVLRFQPMARKYFISTLQKRYQSDIELGNLQISLYPTVRASGDNLVFWFQGRHDRPPLVQIRRFSFEAGFVNFFAIRNTLTGCGWRVCRYMFRHVRNGRPGIRRLPPHRILHRILLNRIRGCSFSMK